MSTNLIKKLKEKRNLTDDELRYILKNDEFDEDLKTNASRVRDKIYGKSIYIRGLIEFTNYCKNNCYYCGIRNSNKNCIRYRLDKNEILECCKEGYNLGFRTFVLQGGEDEYFTDEKMCDIISSIKKLYPDVAVTMSIGERTYESYKKMFDAGAERYLLRHETADNEHYKKLHPKNLSLNNRKQCLFNLKKIGYTVGSGFMIESPFQNIDNLIADLRFLQKLQPEMIGIGPFISHKNTPFKEFKSGTLKMTLKLISVLRLMFPYCLIPATTAIGTISPNGREEGILCGANVLMPNLSPTNVRKKYELYDNKICTGEESAQCIECLKKRVKSVGYNVIIDRGDSKNL